MLLSALPCTSTQPTAILSTAKNPNRSDSAEVSSLHECIIHHRHAHHHSSSLLELFRCSSTSRICFLILLLSTAATVHGVFVQSSSVIQASSSASSSSSTSSSYPSSSSPPPTSTSNEVTDIAANALSTDSTDTTAALLPSSSKLTIELDTRSSELKTLSKSTTPPDVSDDPAARYHTLAGTASSAISAPPSSSTNASSDTSQSLPVSLATVTSSIGVRNKTITSRAPLTALSTTTTSFVHDVTTSAFEIVHLETTPTEDTSKNISSSIHESDSSIDIAEKQHLIEPPQALVASNCAMKDFKKATEDELLKYRRDLESLLAEVDTALVSNSIERRKRYSRYSPISASLPDRESAFFLDRVRAIQVTREEELNSNLNRNNVEESSSSSPQQQNEQYQPQKIRAKPFIPKRNNTVEECKRLSQQELVVELKQKGTYNPDLMAWDASGVIRFLDRSIVDQYERQMKSHASSEETVERNIEALERILAELNLQCDVRSPSVISRIQNLTLGEPRRSVVSPSIRMTESELRSKREVAKSLIDSFEASRQADAAATTQQQERHSSHSQKKQRQKLIGDVHVVPFGCDKRGGEEDGYLRLCAACQAIRRLPDTFFPPFINEVMCDDDKACLYFYDFPHGKCKQKHMNFVVLRNVGTDQCQIWQKFNLNVRVSCECFVDEMSFFAKYV